MLNKKTGVSLIELIVCMVIISLVVLGFFSVELFSSYHVISSERRAKLQNDLSYSLEYMAKYVQQSTGDVNNPPITVYPTSGAQTGFRTHVDLNDPRTPNDLSDDTWVNFYLNGNTLNSLQDGVTEVLSDKIISNFDNYIMPAAPDKGFYVYITDQGTAVEIGLVARYYPGSAVSADNPQIAMKTRLVSSGSSAH
ncbi:MAG: prepilin-type N-terminal cleavage/methylation domain-containing protein [Candidatus Omnitrophota bacterium]|jgi:prepilin-type N-terminal cleavage/methylation domain-containing protein|nr:prepilin-type N-terminal cleavage/methylation domain-containing protein [Candidatus Omnitrophota bacterium]